MGDDSYSSSVVEGWNTSGAIGLSITTMIIGVLTLCYYKLWYSKKGPKRRERIAKLLPPPVVSTLAQWETMGEDMLAERKLQASHALRQVSIFQKKARKESVRLIASAPRRMSAAFKGKKKRRKGASGDGLFPIHSKIQAPSPVCTSSSRFDANWTAGGIINHQTSAMVKLGMKLNENDRKMLGCLLEMEVFNVISEETLLSIVQNCRVVFLKPLATWKPLASEVSINERELEAVVEGSLELFAERGAKWHTILAGNMATGLMETVSILLGLSLPSCVEYRAGSKGCKVVIINANKVNALRKELYSERPETLVRIVRMSLWRYNTVTLMTAVRYLGLVKECRRSENENSTIMSDSTSLESRAKEMASKVLGLAIDEIPIIETDDLGPYSSPNDIKFTLSLVPPGKSIFYKSSNVLPNASKLSSNSVPSLYIVVTGRVAMKIVNSEESSADDSDVVYYVEPGMAIGHLSILSRSWHAWYGGGSSSSKPSTAFCTPVACSNDTYVLEIPQHMHDKLVAKYPNVALSCAKNLIANQSTLMRRLDEAMVWVHLASGQVLVNKGSPVTSLNVVLHGRLREVIDNVVVAEHSRGATIGEAEILTKGSYRSTIRASRDTQLCQVPSSLINVVSREFPEVMLHFAKTISHSFLSTSNNFPRLNNSNRPFHATSVAILPISGSVPIQLFSKSLLKCLNIVCASTLLTSESVAAEFGLSSDEAFGGLDVMADIQGISYLNQTEERHSVVLYQCDWDASAWTKLCIRQADLVLLVANASDDPIKFSTLERELETNNATRELVLLHVNPSEGTLPRRTKDWIADRIVTNHHQIRLFTSSSLQVTNYRSDLSRLARWLTGTSVGLVLGGGGARGIAHLGVLRALEEGGVPIDMIGGTSIGAFFSGVYARDDQMLRIRRTVRQYCNAMGSYWGYVKDLTIPFVSYFSGDGFNENLYRVFREGKIEDCWLSCFCVTTNLTKSCEMVHQNGTLWKYVRASMSLCGYLPPWCDREENSSTNTQYLCDGGYVNNLPADVMKETVGASVIIAVDVCADWTLAGEDYGETLSGWKILYKWLSPFSSSLAAPSLADIQSQLTYVSGFNQLQEAKAKYVDLYLRPPVTEFSTLDFHKFTEIETLGFEYAKHEIRKWKESLCDKNNSDYRLKVLEWNKKRGMARSASFT